MHLLTGARRAHPCATGAVPSLSAPFPTIMPADSETPSPFPPADWNSEPPALPPDALVRDAETIYFCTQGDGMTRATVRAFRMFLRAAEAGHSAAQNYVGLCYLDGYGTHQDLAEAVRWFRTAAAQDNPSAQANLGTCYADGRGVAKDYAEAVRWYRMAAERGVAKAQTDLGVCYSTGSGVEQDFAEALRWFRLAAAERDPWAQYSLGLAFDNGHGVARDLPEAYKWLRLAAAQHYPKASERAAAVTGRMSPEERATAEQLCRAAGVPSALETPPHDSGKQDGQ